VLLLQRAQILQKNFDVPMWPVLHSQVSDRTSLLENSCRSQYSPAQMRQIYMENLSTGQKFNGVKKGFRIEAKIEDDMTKEIKTKAKNAFR